MGVVVAAVATVAALVTIHVRDEREMFFCFVCFVFVFGKDDMGGENRMTSRCVVWACRRFICWYYSVASRGAATSHSTRIAWGGHIAHPHRHHSVVPTLTDRVDTTCASVSV